MFNLIYLRSSIFSVILFHLLIACSNNTLNKIQVASQTQQTEIETINAPVEDSQSNNIKQKFPLFNESQIKQLLSIHNYPEPNRKKFKVVVPTYIPSGFKVSHVNVKFRDEKDSDPRHDSYTIFYKDSNNLCFSLTGLYGSTTFGSPNDNVNITVNSKALGEVELTYTQYTQKEGGHHIDFFQVYDFDQAFLWGQMYAFLSPDSDSLDNTNCQAIGIEEAVKIVESLEFLSY